jgi:hypothetical protein
MNTSDGEVRELRSVPEFEAAIASGAGLLVVTDRSTPTHVHRIGCAAIQMQHFVTKVVTNGAKRGRYYHSPGMDAITARFRSARCCGVCHPDRPAT